MVSSAEPPPLARDRHVLAMSSARGPRTTPAGAGPTNVLAMGALSYGNHPRWRGADGSPFEEADGSAEPPPLARGRPVVPPSQRWGRGTTPAGAGPTPGRDGPPGAVRNHPRWRGADLAPVQAVRRQYEPPPLARGRLRGHDDGGDRLRTTPASAGPTAHPPVRRGVRGNHPRWRGADERTSGSRLVRRNHPRWRGADGRAGQRGVGPQEPPPLARGRRRCRAVRPSAARTTPAGAGPTTKGDAGGTHQENHPRWRGADSAGRIPHLLTTEPPPLARGRPQAPVPLLCGLRTTPAGAGPTP